MQPVAGPPEAAAARELRMTEPSLIPQQVDRGEIAGVLISRERIQARLVSLAEEIARWYAGGEVTFLAALTGSLVFVSDLLRRLPLRVRLEMVRVRSYPGRTTRSRGARVLAPEGLDLAGRDVLIVDDILDSGPTLAALRALAVESAAARVRTCVLLRKRRDDLPGRPDADLVGFDIDDRFVVGYGLDYDNLYRNLPDICLLGPSRREEQA